MSKKRCLIKIVIGLKYDKENLKVDMVLSAVGWTLCTPSDFGMAFSS